MSEKAEKKTKFLDASEIERGIAEIARISRAEGIPVALVGGSALQLWGSDRLTKDVDFVAADILPINVKGPLTFGGVQGFTPTGVPVDLIVRDDDWSDLYEAALYYATTVQDVPVRVVTAEYIVAMKLQADRAKDLLDLEFLMLDAGIDYARSRAIVKEHMGKYAAEELDRYREEVAWERSRRR